ncbi:flagellar basal body rod protein FlgB [Fonticella tunisiensis]|uniref:Flagellar basal body rod protein FlgB n=1 Tax=Fonticella tunisiensis TaxID=1096341 RepID=A0A4R7K9D5_9CLOT|nr:flagellar basal body rod protein FlgB [Fonticella tunisiensis]TDT50615.1 flagellar basal-body rod protein FlgB [Fonticella tunisiensis]
MVQDIDRNTYILIKKSLDASAERSRVIAHNIANINTRGFKASRVVFEEKLNEILNGENIRLKTTDSKHISNGNSISDLSYDVIKDKSTSMRLDGNNVDIDSEMTNLAANTILYNTLISQANSRIAMMRYVINEGRR